MTGRATGGGIVVMLSVAAFRPTTNPYVTELVAALPEDVRVVTFSRRRALLGRVDVFHVHWPEVMFRRRTRLRSALASVLFLLVLVALRVRGVRFVRTMHNESPHEAASRVEALLLGLLDRWTGEVILLNRHTRLPAAVPPGAPVTVIPLGEHRSTFEAHRVPDAVPGRVLHFGLIRPYKGIDVLVQAFASWDDPAASLRIVGPLQDDGALDDLRRSVSGDDRVILSPGFVPDDVLVHEIGEARLVVLPYRRMHNSGAVLLALSLGRPVLVPSNAVTSDLAEEVGSGWVRTYTDGLDSRKLAAAEALPFPAQPPRLAARSWLVIGAAHADVYRRAAAR